MLLSCVEAQLSVHFYMAYQPDLLFKTQLQDGLVVQVERSGQRLLKSYALGPPPCLLLAFWIGI